LLVVEDEPAIALPLVRALERAGYEVNLCSTAFDAINYLEMEPGIVAIVTDIQLGDGTSGWDVAAAVRARYPGVCLVYLTEGGVLDHEFYGLPNSASLVKPVTPERLLAAISELLWRKGGGVSRDGSTGSAFKARGGIPHGTA
jgi:DNA-binding response OmpR family regulator